MDFSSTLNKIDALRALIATDSITPDSLGLILKEMMTGVDAAIDSTIEMISNIQHPVSVSDTDEADLIISDENNNAIATFADGQIRTANFDSGAIKVEETSAADLILADAAGNAIATFSGGHIRTANFNSANITANSSASSGSSDSDSDTSSGSTTSATGKITLTGKWCTLGDSITRQDYDKTDGLRGYQTWVKKQITFSGGYSNLGVNGWTMQHQALALDAIKVADYFTIAFGSNDWLAAQEIGTIDDYKNDTGTNTMFGSARKIINKIRQLNIDAKIIMCTPRKCYNPTYTGATWEAPNSRGATLAQYAEAIRQIAQYESFPIADFFSESSTNQANLAALSITTDGDGIAVHPNTQGHKLLAGILIQKFLYFTQV